jgi:hypothetical protein
MFLGLVVNIKSGARKNISDTGLTIAFFLVFFGSITVIIE